jgi:DNA-binding MarR family transcriptional regulator
MNKHGTRTHTSSASSARRGETIRRLTELFQTFGPQYKRWLHEAVESRGITHYRVLAELAAHGPMMMNALGQELCVTPRYVTALVDHLEADGFVRRRPHPADRRATLVELTDAGAAASSVSGGTIDRAHAELLSALSPAQQESLLDCLETLLPVVQGRPAAADEASAPAA